MEPPAPPWTKAPRIARPCDASAEIAPPGQSYSAHVVGLPIPRLLRLGCWGPSTPMTTLPRAHKRSRTALFLYYGVAFNWLAINTTRASTSLKTERRDKSFRRYGNQNTKRKLLDAFPNETSARCWTVFLQNGMFQGYFSATPITTTDRSLCRYGLLGVMAKTMRVRQPVFIPDRTPRKWAEGVLVRFCRK